MVIIADIVLIDYIIILKRQRLMLIFFFDTQG